MRKKQIFIVMSIVLTLIVLFLAQKIIRSIIASQYSPVIFSQRTTQDVVTLHFRETIGESIPSLTTTPENQHILQCIEKQFNLPINIYDGVIALGGYGGDSSYLLDLSSSTLSILDEGKKIRSLTSSPDYAWLAYHDYENDKLIVLNATTGHKIIIPWEDDWLMLDGWLDGEHLIINMSGDEKGYLLINPVSNEKKYLADNFPDLSSVIYGHTSWWGSAKYSAGLNYVVYPRLDSHIVLWDVQNRREVVSLWSRGEPFAKMPVWSPSGNDFLTSINLFGEDGQFLSEGLFRVSIDGQITQLTYPDSTTRLEYSGYAWSPNERLVAFWIREYGNEYRLAVLSIQTLRITEYCITSDTPESPIWSPDSAQLVVSALDDNNDYATLLVDINKLESYRIADYFTLGGWLKSP
jgi:hypothetical protein